MDRMDKPDIDQSPELGPDTGLQEIVPTSEQDNNEDVIRSQIIDNGGEPPESEPKLH